jgi:hypothetical protein
MELFRVSRNAWGQETLTGVSWDLLWVFVGAAVIFIVVHILYKWLLAPDGRPPRASADRSEIDQKL